MTGLYLLICKNCGKNNSHESQTCIQCEISLAPDVQAQAEKENMTCKKCGHINSVGTDLCHGKNYNCLETILQYGMSYDPKIQQIE
jgi:ribosomal protein L40E